MMTAAALGAISEMRGLAPLRAVSERAYGAALPAIDFPITAFASDPLDGDAAWELWRSIRRRRPLEPYAVVVTSADSCVLDDPWEAVCRKAAERLALRELAPPPHVERRADVLGWLQTPGVRAVLRHLGVDAPGPEVDADDLDESLIPLLSANDPPAPRSIGAGLALLSPILVRANAAVDVDWMGGEEPLTVYVLDVEPWAGPLALGWLFTNARWQKLVPLLRRWHEAYGFDVTAVGLDTIEAYVRKPPRTLEDVGARLLESLEVCPDAFDDGLSARLLMVLGQSWTLRFDV